MTGRRVVLIDGSALVFRAFYALPQTLRTASGLPTNAIYGFATMFRKVLSGREVSWGAVVFDAPGQTFRSELYPEYKAQRPKVPSDLVAQLPWVDRLAEAFGFVVLRVPGVEADDVIGTLARRAEAQGDDVLVVSGDKDFCQLVSEAIRLLEPLRDVTMDTEWVRKRWNVRPDQFAELLGLMGDSIDNIPGVPGVGAKGAATLLGRFDTLDGILTNIDQLTGRQKAALTEFAEQARLSADLATIRTDVSLPVTIDDLALRDVPESVRTELFTELEFYSLLEQAPERDREAEPDVTVLSDEKAATRFCESLGDGVVGVTVITDGPSAVRGVTLGVAIAGERVGWLDLRDPTGAVSVVGEWLADETVDKVLCGVRDALSALSRHGISLGGVDADTGLASFLLDPAGHMPHDHAQVVRHTLKQPAADLSKEVPRGGTVSDIPLATLIAVAGRMAVETRDAWEVLDLQLRDVGLYDLMVEQELPLSYVLAAMQDIGICVDADALRALQIEFTTRRDAVEATIHELAGHPVNPGSPKQLSEVLFEELGLPVLKRTKTGYSTDASVLERLAVEHDIAREILRWRELAKLVSTYTRVLLEAVNPDDGRVHPTYGQTTSVSGRLICTEPDLQRTPIRTEDGRRIREAFVPRDGWRLISADYSQIELRLLAHMSGDEALVIAFNDGADVHRRTAAQLFDVPETEVTSAQRRTGKTVNFATLYGQGATALSQQIGVSRSEAKSLINRYFVRYSGVRRWLDETIERATESGYCETLMGRRRQIRELSSKNPQTRSYGERIATNTPIQGSAADLCKRAMLRIDEALHREGLAARMLLQIHDELVFECPPDEVDATSALVTHHMQTVFPLDVPLVVDVGVGDSWLDAHGA